LTELVPLNAFSEETFTLFALEAVQPVGRVVPVSKFVQMASPPLHPPLDDELELLEELLVLDELLELEEVLELEEELELLLDELLDVEELLELEELDDELELVPPQAAKAQDARMTGINFRMTLCLIIVIDVSALHLVPQPSNSTLAVIVGPKVSAAILPINSVPNPLSNVMWLAISGDKSMGWKAKDEQLSVPAWVNSRLPLIMEAISNWRVFGIIPANSRCTAIHLLLI
jgi:hypothetical protein